MKFWIALIFTSCLCSLGYGQNLGLADNYVDQGEYYKALKIYHKAYNDNPRNANIAFKIIDVYHQQEAYNKVDSLLDTNVKNLASNKQTIVERGYNYSLQGKDSLAQTYYNQAIAIIDSVPRTAYSIARRLEQRNLFEQAIIAYETAMKSEPKLNFNLQLAGLYGQQGKLDLMFSKYVDLIESNPSYQARAQVIFSRHITSDAQEESNKSLRKVLLLRLRENQNPLYNELLSWLFVQQKDFKKAFIQEKAIYVRDKESMQALKDLAVVAIEEKDDQAAHDILQYIVEESPSQNVRYIAQSLQLQLKTNRATPQEYPSIKKEYEQLLQTYGTDGETFKLQLDYASFLAFKNNEATLAIDILTHLEKEPLSKFQRAQTHMQLADILVLQEQFNRALILFSKVQSDLPNDALAQEAQYKVARTSFFQGDFPWSLTQLKVLRGATSKLIANDAMQLSLTISDHSQEDTTFVALKSYAKARLKKYQNQPSQAIELFEKLVLNHKEDPILDEAILEQARIHKSLGNDQKAASLYQLIIDNHSDGILADDAYYELGLIYESNLEMPEKAKMLYERIIYDHADSIHFIDARRRFRRLRGDTNEKAF